MLRSLRKARRLMYRGGSVLGDVDALASGDPRRVASRFLVRKPAWRLAGRFLRRLP
jgi:hypothetical protein